MVDYGPTPALAVVAAMPDRQPTPSSSKLVLMRPGDPPQEFALSTGSVTIGRSQINDIVVDESNVSRMQARLTCDAGVFTLHDLQSRNGTLVNGSSIQTARLNHGDRIQIGSATLGFEHAAPAPDPRATVIESPPRLESGSLDQPLLVSLSNTDEPRVVVHTPIRTWEVLLRGDAVCIGRDSSNQVVLDSDNVSRNHAVIEPHGGGYRVRDLGSANGTWMGNQKVTSRVLKSGTTIRIGGCQLVFKAGFSNDELSMANLPSPVRTTKRRPVVIVPGVMGSELWQGSEKIWPNLKLLITNPELLKLDNPHVEARDILREIVVVPGLVKLAQYSRLADYLKEGLGYEPGRDLLEFYYDWRQDNRVSARRLGQLIEEWQQRSPDAAGPVTIVAHSMGCLVSRYYVERLGGTDRVERLILIGGPHYGSPRIVSNLVQGPDILPFGLMNERLRQVLVGLPYAYQLIPAYDCAVDGAGRHFNLLEWEEWAEERGRPLLRSARAFHAELGDSASVPTVSVFGYGLATITKLTVGQQGTDQSMNIDFGSEPLGDTAVPEPSAVLRGTDIHPVEQHHGSLYTDNDVLMRLKLELTRGFGRRS